MIAAQDEQDAAQEPRPILFSDRGCPYAHRVLALLDHLGVEHEERSAALGLLPEGIAQWSPSGRIPLLVHGALVISESRVMLDHLAEAYGFDVAYAPSLEARTLERHAMALADTHVAPWLTRREGAPDTVRLGECLDAFEAAMIAEPTPSLVAFHLAPLWLRFQWWHPDGAVTRAIRERARLAAWLDRATELTSVARTAPTRAENVADFRAACARLGAADG